MERGKKKRLEAAGFRGGSAKDFLGLSAVEAQLVEMKVALSARLRRARQLHQLTQAELAERLGSSQSRVAKMEAGDPSVSMDLLIQGLLAAGATPHDIAKAMAPPQKKAAGA
jgi:DNA-binding XRE family transcriptional regulator